jgi:hypothetical protein
MSLFKFGKYATPQGPYTKYREPFSEVRPSRNQLITSSAQTRQRVVSNNISGNGGGYGGIAGSQGADFGGGGPGAQSSNAQGGYGTDRYNPVYDQLEEGTILENWIPRDGAGLDMLFRRIYLRDPTIGPGIDLIKNLPWSDFNLDGIEDKAIRDVYEDCMDQLQIQALMPDVTGDFLVIGRNVLSLIFDSRKGIFSGVIPHDPDFIRVTPLPVYGFDPLCDYKISPAFKRFLNSSDPRIMDARKALPPAFLDAANKEQGFLPLDPVSTIYLARKASQHDSVGTSLLTRALYFWAIEKALLNAQMASTRRRARSFIHLIAGIDNVWEPTSEEIDSLAGMVMQANEDPIGGVIATRTGVTMSEPVGGGADFYKWSDELELFSKYKMQCIGISDALLNGDATYSNAEQARSVFVESLATLRSNICQRFFYQKLFPTIARIHGFQKRSQAELNHNIRVDRSTDSPEYAYQKYLRDRQEGMPSWANVNAITASRLTQRKAMQIPINDLIIPTINWHKQLKPNQDEKMLEILERLSQNEIPTTLADWARAAGVESDPEKMKAAFTQDAELRKTIESIKQAMEDEAPEESDEEGGGDEAPPASEGGEAPAPETPEQEANDDEVTDLIDQITTEPKEEIKQSLQAKISLKIPRKLADIPIWNQRRCGPLSKYEAETVLTSLLRDNTSLLKNPQDALEFLQAKTNKRKAAILAYVLNRLNLCKVPVDASVEQDIISAAKAHALRHTKTTSKAALLDLRKFESELQVLSKITGATNGAQGPRLSTDKLVRPMGNKIFGGE